MIVAVVSSLKYGDAISQIARCMFTEWAEDLEKNLNSLRLKLQDKFVKREIGSLPNSGCLCPHPLLSQNFKSKGKLEGINDE